MNIFLFNSFSFIRICVVDMVEKYFIFHASLFPFYLII